jgi:superfamily II DNA or RNA helicase
VPALHDFQSKAVERALAAPGRRWIFNDEMGLGKTPEAITAARSICETIRGSQRMTQWYPRVLVVTPAIVRLNWLRELDVWWPEHPPVGVISAGRANKSLTKAAIEQRDAALTAPIQVVSYSLVGEVDLTQWDVIIPDEAHRIKDARAKWSKTVRAIVEANPSAAVFGLTGTLMPNTPMDVYNILDTIWPGRFGSRSKFGSRYANYEERTWVDFDGEEHTAREYYGVNEEHAPELRDRLSALSSRTTKPEVAHLLPAYDVQTVWMSGEKIPAVVEWVADAAESATHIAVLTYYRDSAQKLAKALAGVHDVTHVDGSYPPDTRNRMLDISRRAPNSVVVATVDSVGIGIDMTFCTQALFAELPASQRPETMIQGLGRFSRLSGTVPSRCVLMVQEGSQDEVIADALQEKISAINAAIKAGKTESELESVMRVNTEDWRERLGAAIENMPEENGYGL